MSTSCKVHFKAEGDNEISTIYIHADGYPHGTNGMLSKLERFLNDVEEQCVDTRFHDPSYLAAKFVVWSAFDGVVELSKAFSNPLNFLGIGVIPYNSDIAVHHEYFVICPPIGQGRPATLYQGSKS
jgi:hypothetical protein